MATKTLAEREAELPPGVSPLLSQRQLEAYYGVSDWTVKQWLKAGIPTEPVRSPTGAADRTHHRFDLAKVRAWMAAETKPSAA